LERIKEKDEDGDPMDIDYLSMKKKNSKIKEKAF